MRYSICETTMSTDLDTLSERFLLELIIFAKYQNFSKSTNVNSDERRLYFIALVVSDAKKLLLLCAKRDLKKFISYRAEY